MGCEAASISSIIKVEPGGSHVTPLASYQEQAPFGLHPSDASNHIIHPSVVTNITKKRYERFKEEILQILQRRNMK